MTGASQLPVLRGSGLGRMVLMVGTQCRVVGGVGSEQFYANCYKEAFAATQILSEGQLLLFGKALRSPHDHPTHVSSFIPVRTTQK